ncbi:hypothetical protein SFOMI_4683 [Sphingobium fuliginis]|uniref:Uncharacterized protein n=1 Tax=Sphingobium fuliginis (strain ATCC 27551) TaxID=336203 RepID=A0A292ZMN4_SPHSA|nr:hypothetical protein SFOMI_4683 [Sphingobium fuliginis]
MQQQNGLTMVMTHDIDGEFKAVQAHAARFDHVCLLWPGYSAVGLL